jgi:hypothetical protein
LIVIVAAELRGYQKSRRRGEIRDGMERRRRRNSLVSTRLERLLERRGSKAATAAAPCAVAVATWHPCSNVFPSRVLFGIKKVLYPYPITHDM